MIITDGIHLVSTSSEDELHAFAKKIGLKRSWYQSHPDHPHYDLIVPRSVYRACAYGAKLVSSKELLKTAWWSSIGNPILPGNEVSRIANPAFSPEERITDEK